MAFIKLGTQAVVGSKYVPKQVINGPQNVFLWPGQRIHNQLDTIPRWSNFVSQELLTASQLTVISHLDCLWQRDLSSLHGKQLQAATAISNAELETYLKKLWELKAKHFVNRYRLENLIALLGDDERQLLTVTRNHTRLKECLWADLKQQLGALGLVIKELKINITLPEHLRQELENLWRLQQFQGCIANLTELNLAEAIGHGQPTINLLLDQTTGFVNNYPAATPTREIIPFPHQRINGNGSAR